MGKFLIIFATFLLNSAFVINGKDNSNLAAVMPSLSEGITPQATPKSKIPPVSISPEKAKPVSIPRFENTPVIDGSLDDEVWKDAAVFKDFYQTDPGDNTRPSQPTEVMIGYDAKFLYFAFRAFDEPGKVRATIARRDQIFDDDYVGIYLDTFNDQRRAYALFFNPLGIQHDGVFVEGGGEDSSVDLVMESKGVVTDTGFTVEIAIPFKSLRYEAGKGKVWGLQLYRRIKHANNELDSWMPYDRGNSSVLSQAGHITGLENISVERTLEIIPSLTVSETGNRVPSPGAVTTGIAPVVGSGRFLNRPVELDAGVTAKFSITPAITLDLAYNPDFAQVEADATVITANQRFPIFFAEKRPFFLEGKEIFQTQLQAVNTRAIIDPDFAAKLTGRRGKNTFALLVASDNAPGNFDEEERTNPENLRFLDKNALVGILRLKRDIGRESNLGFIATSYNFVERRNNLAGIDGRFRLNPQTVFSFQVLGTNSRRYFDDFFDNNARNTPRYRTGNGVGYFASYDVSKRHFGYLIEMSGRTRDYRAEVGFTPRTNYNLGEFFVRYSTDPKPNGKIISRRIQSYQDVQFDFQGRLQRLEWNPQASIQLRRQTFLGIGFRRAFEKIYEEEFGYVRTTDGRAGAFFGNSERATNRTGFFVFGETTLSEKISGEFRLGLDKGAFDFDFGAGRRFPRVSPAYLAYLGIPNNTGNQPPPLDPGAGNLLDGYFRIVYQPTDALRTSFEYTKSRLVRVDTRRTAFDENIFAMRATYQFTRATFIRTRIDYSTLAARVRGQFLIGYAPSPGTAFYAGYNNDLNYNGSNPFSGAFEPGLRRNRQTFFIKATYLFRSSF